MAQLEPAFRGELWLAESGGRTLGFVACSGNDISWLYVDPAYFRRGVGRSLLRHAIINCGAIADAYVLANNAACLALMELEGFTMAKRETIVIPGHGEALVHKMRRVTLRSD
jgi:ribosomal protein S18 acetylase RimI-like enzyme